MKKEEIIEGNKLIAEFMGWELWESIFDGFGFNVDPEIIPDARNDHSNFHKINDLRFNSSWDWLMPVIEKIEELGSYQVCGIKCYESITISRNLIQIYFNPEQKFLLQLKLQSGELHDDVWKHPLYKEHIIKQFDFQKYGRLGGLFFAVIEFIKWYNEKYKTNKE